MIQGSGKNSPLAALAMVPELNGSEPIIIDAFTVVLSLNDKEVQVQLAEASIGGKRYLASTDNALLACLKLIEDIRFHSTQEVEE